MKTEIIVTQMSINYDKKLNISSVSYSTTIPTSVPLELACDIIQSIVNSTFYYTVNVNNANRSRGTLEGITEDVGQEHYCFSVGNNPKNIDKKELVFSIDLDEYAI